MGKRRVVLSVLISMSGLFPLLNSFGNSRLAGLHGSDYMQLIASGLCFGFGFGILLGGRKLLDR